MSVRSRWSQFALPPLLLGGALSALLSVGCQNYGSIGSASEEVSAPVTEVFQDGVSPYATYRGTKDAVICEHAPSDMMGSTLTAYSDQDSPNGTKKDAEALLSFSISHIPAASKVSAASLTLHITNETNSIGFQIYALKKSWTESQVNWNAPDGTHSWDSKGAKGKGDRFPTSLGTLHPITAGTATVTLNAAGVAVVQGWVNDSSTNHGLILDNPSNGNAVIFSTSEAAAALRPKLSVTFVPASGAGTGTGLLGEYFGDETFSNLVTSRVDKGVNFNWTTAAPAPAVPSDAFGVRWSGRVQPANSETYTFFVSQDGDGGARLWVNGVKLVDAWTSSPTCENSGTIALVANQKYDIKLEYREHIGSSAARLSWSSKNQAKEIIPASRLFPASPRGPGQTPIKYIVVIVKENHSFDNYFMDFPGAETSATAPRDGESDLTRPPAPNHGLPRDMCHNHACAAKVYAAGKMDKFDLNAVDKSGKRDNLTYVYYAESQIPNYWQYARNFVLADHVFSTTLSQSFPGHFATVSGFNRALANPTCLCGGTCTVPSFASSGEIVNTVPCWNAPSLVQHLEGRTWAEYGGHELLAIKSVFQMPDVESHMKGASSALSDINAGGQPNLMMVHMSGGSTSEHPPQDVCPGENASVALINAIMNGPHWKETAVVLLWDDWGGFYDSVKPPAEKFANGDYIRPGFRVPLMIISPYAKKGYVLKTPSEQTGVVRLVEDLWGTARLFMADSAIEDGSVGSLMGAFDFTQAPRAPFVLTPRTCN